MKKAVVVFVSALFVFFLFSRFASAQSTPAASPKEAASTAKFIPVSEIHAGMKGVAYTVFEGTRPEAMDVEVLGILRNTNGPRGDLILVRLGGAKAEYAGVVAGMSGSPVYFSGRLAGAVSFRIGQFSKEAIAGVTPIEEMLEINEMDRTVPAEAGTGGGRQDAARPAAGQSVRNEVSAGGAAAASGYANYLQPIDTPLVFSGFSEETIKRFAPKFASAGIVPVMGIGGVSPEKQPEPLVPGSAVSAVLVRGDMDIAATCTVTYVDPERLLACGHPILQYGPVDIPMTKAQVLATLPSPLNAFKIVNATEEVGTFVQDRHTGILGRFGRQPEMIPVTLSIHGGAHPKQYHFEVLNNAKLTPLAMSATVFNALQGMNETGESITYRLQGQINVSGYSPVSLQNMFAPLDGNIPTGMAVALAVGEHFGRIFENSFTTPKVTGVDLEFDLVNERRSARLETTRTDVTEARPGDEIVIEAVLRPYRGEPIVRQIPVKIPTSAPKGMLRILVSDGETLDRMGRAGNVPGGTKLDLASTIALLNKEHANDRLYVSLLENNPQALVEDKVMP
ncbi:MAG: SpoIVB peptidase S55, partial [Acidobacteria bacterium]|nr:SpoIVB peptidase S55 [Acidobacteriota bacterium]